MVLIYVYVNVANFSLKKKQKKQCGFSCVLLVIEQRDNLNFKWDPPMFYLNQSFQHKLNVSQTLSKL